MKEEDKAKELIEMFTPLEESIEFSEVKRFALKCVEEKIQSLNEFSAEYNIKDDWFEQVFEDRLKYYQKVKTIIQNEY